MSARAPVFMSDKRYGEISDRIRKDYPNSCILFIDEVVNPYTRQAYEQRKETIAAARGGSASVEEAPLFHGTHANLIDRIAEEGFDPTKNVAAAYGPGTYFAKSAAYSFHYMKSADKNGISYMFMCDVLIGKKIIYNSQVRDRSDYDNSVDNVQAPTIIVTPYCDGAYPRFIIAFHKSAK